LVDIKKRRADRPRVMQAIFDAAEGSEAVLVSGAQLLHDLGLSDQDLRDACRYHEGEGLISLGKGIGGTLTPSHMHRTSHAALPT